ncbi:hypothetical protein [Variovorax sp. dw_308]|uniref:hypothetical protein n=1 Tax=Variovorax sp. dw_308 TaxID=2721546 RepID=UPI001C4490FF|nr:hypothetical protein [Variovorax sp. dw_308]
MHTSLPGRLATQKPPHRASCAKHALTRQIEDVGISDAQARADGHIAAESQATYEEVRDFFERDEYTLKVANARPAKPSQIDRSPHRYHFGIGSPRLKLASGTNVHALRDEAADPLLMKFPG